MMPAWPFWFSNFNWAAAIAFILALAQWLFEISEFISKKEFVRIGLSTALMISVGIAWWVAAVQEKQQAPRTLNQKQQKTISDAVSEFEVNFQVITYPSDPEPASFSQQLTSTLQAAGWNFIPTNGFIMENASGLIVAVNKDKNNEKNRAAATALAKTLNQLEIATRLSDNATLLENIDIQIQVAKK